MLDTLLIGGATVAFVLVALVYGLGSKDPKPKVPVTSPRAKRRRNRKPKKKVEAVQKEEKEEKEKDNKEEDKKEEENKPKKKRVRKRKQSKKKKKNDASWVDYSDAAATGKWESVDNGKNEAAMKKKLAELVAEQRTMEDDLVQHNKRMQKYEEDFKNLKEARLQQSKEWQTKIDAVQAEIDAQIEEGNMAAEKPTDILSAKNYIKSGSASKVMKYNIKVSQADSKADEVKVVYDELEEKIAALEDAMDIQKPKQKGKEKEGKRGKKVLQNTDSPLATFNQLIKDIVDQKAYVEKRVALLQKALVAEPVKLDYKQLKADEAQKLKDLDKQKKDLLARLSALQQSG